MANPNVKLNRTYLLTAETRDGSMLKVKPPFTLIFDIVRKNFGYANTASFRIYNLNERNRNNLRYDQFDMGVPRQIQLDAGYIGSYDGNDVPIAGQLATIFKGNFSQAYSARQGVDFVTTIQAKDSGFASANAQSNWSFRSGTPFESVLSTLMKDLKPYNIKPAAIGDSYKGKTLSRGNTYSGSTIDLLTELSGKGFYVDNGISYCLGDSECIQGAITQIDFSNGLLGTPYLEETFLSFDILFEPRFKIGQKIFLKSGTASDNITNREYKVTGLHHRGTISGSVCGDAVTTLSCLYGPNGLNLVVDL